MSEETRHYRGKRKDNGEWVYGYLIGNDVIVGNIVEWDSEYFCTEFWLKVDPETVGQYTGLKDKKGKEIFKSDLCTDGDGKSLYKIVWSPNHQWGVLVIKGGVLSTGLTFPLWHWDECKQNGFKQLEIIRSIHDPELEEVSHE